MKYLRILISIALVGWTLFSLAGVVLSLLLNGPETAFLILWAAVAAVAVFVWASIEGGVWFYHRLFTGIVRIASTDADPDALEVRQDARIDAPPSADPQEQWRAEGITPDPETSAGPEEPSHEDPWAHAPDYETGEDPSDHRDDEFPTIREQFPRL